MDIHVDINSLSVKKQYWPSLGINYNVEWSGFNAQKNLEFLKILRENFESIRVSYADHLYPQYAIDNQLMTIAQAKTLGFKIIMWGIANNAVPQTNASITAHVAKFQQLVPLAEQAGCTHFGGNEIDTDAHRLRSINLVEASTPVNKAWARLPSAHDYIVGQTVEISGISSANTAYYNGERVITQVVGNDFEYQMPGNVVTPAGGSPKVGLTKAYLRQIEKDKALFIKNNSSMKSIYCASQGNSATSWLGETDTSMFDYMGLNNYGNTVNDIAGFEDLTKQWKDKFGDKAMVTETNVHANWTTASAVSEAEQARLMMLRLDVLKRLNVQTFYFTFNWGSTGDPFALRKSTGEYRPLWDLIKATEFKIFGGK